MSDQSEFERSMAKETIGGEGSPYETRKFNFINDINSAVYTNNSASLVQFDLSSLFTSGQFIDPANMYLVIPMVYTACFTTGAIPVAPTAGVGNEWLITPKNGSYQLVQSVECIVNGESVVQQQSNINFFVNFKVLSQMSPSDLLSWGKTLGIYPDDVQSLLYNGSGSGTASGVVGGNGLSNNMIFPITATGTAGNPNMNQQTAFNAYGLQGQVYNTALQERSKRIAQGGSGLTATTSANGILGGSTQTATTAVMAGYSTSSGANTEFRPYFSIVGNYMTWLDYSIIRLGDICDFFLQAPLLKGMDCLIRLYINTGYVSVGLTTAQARLNLSGANSTFSNTCPFTINQPIASMIPATTTNLVVSANIAKSTLSTSVSGVSLSNSGGQSSMLACRLYYPMIKLQPAKALKYVQENRKKEIVFRNVVANTFAPVSAGGTFNQLVQSAIRRPKGILICPFLSASTNGNNTALASVPFAQYSSPFDTCPGTCSPISLTQLNVNLGGLPVLPYNYSYTFEDYVQEVSLYEKLSPIPDFGLSCGLISQYMWEVGFRYYWVDLSRGSVGDANTARNVTISFLNNSLQPVDIWTFIEYYDVKYVDVETGRLTSA